jgi:hypothetical protein
MTTCRGTVGISRFGKNITAANAIIENLSIVDMRRERNGIQALLFSERG